MLVARIAGKDNFVGVDVVFRGGGDVFGFRDAHTEAAENEQASRAQAANAGKLLGEEKRAPQRDAGVNQPKQHRRTHETEARYEKNGKKKGCAESAEIVKCKHVRDDVTELVAVADDAHE